MKIFRIAILSFISLIPVLTKAQEHGFKMVESEKEYKANKYMRFTSVSAIAVDGEDNIYIATENGENVVQKINSNGDISVILKREDAKDYRGLHIAADKDGALYLSVQSRFSIERFEPEQTWSTIVGKVESDKALQIDGPVERARLKEPGAIAVAKNGTVYFADSKLIRRLKDGFIKTIAGRENIDALHVDELLQDQFTQRRKAAFVSPISIAIDHEENIYVLDNGEDHRESDPFDYQQLIAISPDLKAAHVFKPRGVHILDKNNETIFETHLRPALSRFGGHNHSIDVDFKEYLNFVTFTSNYLGDLELVNGFQGNYLYKNAGIGRWKVQAIDAKPYIPKYGTEVCALGMKDTLYCISDNQLYALNPKGHISIFLSEQKNN